MTNLFFHLLTLLLSLKVYILHATAQHTPIMNNQVLEAIREAYYSSIVNSTNITLTRGELNNYLLHIIQPQDAPSTTVPESRRPFMSNNYIDMSCKPTPHILSSDEVYDTLLQTSKMRSIVTEIVTNTSCIQLQRCTIHSGCCHGDSKCEAIRQATVFIPIPVRVLATRANFTEMVPFTNDVECSCVSPIELCLCVEPFISRISNDTYKCTCNCSPNDETCQSISDGGSRITDWSSLIRMYWTNRSLLDSITFYKNCIRTTEEGHHHRTGLYCPPIPCASGKTFNFTSRMCEDIITAQPQQISNSRQSYINRENLTTQSYLSVQSSTNRDPTTSPTLNSQPADPTSRRDNSENVQSHTQQTDTTHSSTAFTQPITTTGTVMETAPQENSSQPINSTENRTKSSSAAKDMFESVLHNWNANSILKYVLHRGMGNTHNDMRIMRKISKGLQEFCADYRDYCLQQTTQDTFSYTITATRLITYQCTIKRPYCAYISDSALCPQIIFHNIECENVDSQAVRHQEGRRRYRRL